MRLGFESGRVAIVAVSALIFGGIGFTIAALSGPGREDAASERKAAYEEALLKAEASAYQRSFERGRQKGTEQGKAQATAVSSPAPTPSAEQSADDCPSRQVMREHMDTRFCGPPIPENCPPGEAPVAASASCEPLAEEDQVSSDGGSGASNREPCLYGPAKLCTPEENARESELESYCGGPNSPEC
jgi:hypothetical protein